VGETINEIARYNIYRKIGTGEYSLLSTTTQLTYSDLKVELAKEYYYLIKSVSVYGVESPETKTVTSVTPIADTTLPVIAGFNPVANTRLGREITVSVIATDNVKSGINRVLCCHNFRDVSIGKSESGSITFHTKQYITEGDLTLKAIVKDAAGNSATQNVIYKADNVAPVAPILTAAPGELSVQLSWTMTVMPTDFSHYHVYLLADGVDPADHTDPPVAKVTVQLYKHNVTAESRFFVTAVDTLGNESVPSNVAVAAPGLDATPPVISSLTPGNRTTVRSDITLLAAATDNVGIDTYTFEAIAMEEDPETGSLAIQSEASWIEVGLIPAASGSSTGSTPWNTRDVRVTPTGPVAKYPDGFYTLRVTAKDKVGNLASKSEVVKVANNPPLPPEGLRADAGEWRLMISWKPFTGTDVAGYVVERAVKNAGDADYGVFSEVSRTTSNIYINTLLNPLHQYSYRVAMINDLGNIGPWATVWINAARRDQLAHLLRYDTGSRSTI
jgi:hypothetical protein